MFARLVFPTRILAVAALLTLTLVGCGAGKTTAKGKVSYKGKTVVWGTVILVDSTGLYHQGDISLDGTYEIAGVPVGLVKIAVTSPDPEGAAKRGGGRGAAPPKGNKDVQLEDPRAKFAKDAGAGSGPERPLPPAGSWFALPKEIADPTTSGLSAEVQAGKPLDIDIK